MAIAGDAPAPILKLVCSSGGSFVTDHFHYSGGISKLLSFDSSLPFAALQADLKALFSVAGDRRIEVKYRLPVGPRDAFLALANDDDLAVLIGKCREKASPFVAVRPRLFVSVLDSGDLPPLIDATPPESVLNREEKQRLATEMGRRIKGTNGGDQTLTLDSSAQAADPSFPVEKLPDCFDVPMVVQRWIKELEDSESNRETLTLAMVSPAPIVEKIPFFDSVDLEGLGIQNPPISPFSEMRERIIGLGGDKILAQIPTEAIGDETLTCIANLIRSVDGGKTIAEIPMCARDSPVRTLTEIMGSENLAINSNLKLECLLLQQQQQHDTGTAIGGLEGFAINGSKTLTGVFNPVQASLSSPLAIGLEELAIEGDKTSPSSSLSTENLSNEKASTLTEVAATTPQFSLQSPKSKVESWIRELDDSYMNTNRTSPPLPPYPPVKWLVERKQQLPLSLSEVSEMVTKKGATHLVCDNDGRVVLYCSVVAGHKWSDEFLVLKPVY